MNMLKGFSKHNKQAILLYACTLLGIFAGVISSVINTHFIAPEDYGDVRYVQNVLTLVTTVVLFGHFQSGSRLLALSNDEKYNRKVKGALVLVLLFSNIILIFTCLIGSVVPTEKESVPFLFLISIPVCGNMLYNNYINITSQGDNQINRIAIIRLVPAFIYLPLSYFIYSKFGATSTKMILLQWGLGTILGVLTIVSTKPVFKGLESIFNDIHNENKKYGNQLYIGSLVMVATNYLAGIFLGLFNTDNSQVGYYTLALTVTTPLMQLPAIIGTTYFKKFASEPRIPEKVLQYTLLLSVISCVIFILLIKPMVSFLYSDRYAAVGSYAVWLAIGYTLHGIGDMLNRFIGSHGLGKEIRNASIVNGIFKILGYVILVYLFNTEGAIATTVLCSTIYTGCIYYYYRKLISETSELY